MNDLVYRHKNTIIYQEFHILRRHDCVHTNDVMILVFLLLDPLRINLSRACYHDRSIYRGAPTVSKSYSHGTSVPSSMPLARLAMAN
jgi:hypothetical protein